VCASIGRGANREGLIAWDASEACLYRYAPLDDVETHSTIFAKRKSSGVNSTSVGTVVDRIWYCVATESISITHAGIACGVMFFGADMVGRIGQID